MLTAAGVPIGHFSGHFTESGSWTRGPIESASMPPSPGSFVVSEEPTTAVVQRYLDALAGDAPAEPIVRELLERAAYRLERLCATMLHRSYPRLTGPPTNLETAEMLGGVVEGLLKAMRSIRPRTVREFFALANQHMRWQLNDLARRLDERPAAVELREGLVPAPASSESGHHAGRAAGCWRRSTTCRRTSARSSAWCAFRG